MDVTFTAGTGEYPSFGLRRQGTEISNKDFRRLSKLFTSTCGIKMPKTKRAMLQTRLMRRIKHLEMSSMGEYCDFLFSEEGIRQELTHAIDAITTNKTEFFREPAHMKYLANETLPHLAVEQNVGFRRPLRLWSAGCSTGEEPYTLAMVMNNFAETNEGFNFSIFASDISTKALDAARLAIYHNERVTPVPFEMKRKYLLRSRDDDKRQVRVVPQLRNKVQFHRLNFAENYALDKHMDIIFFRNVLIYFDKDAQEKILGRLIRFLNPGGYLFIGHSETISSMNLPLRQVAPAIYRKEEGAC